MLCTQYKIEIRSCQERNTDDRAAFARLLTVLFPSKILYIDTTMNIRAVTF